MSQKYTAEFKARALKLIDERVGAEQCLGWVACTAVGEALGGISPHTVRNWWKQDLIDQGQAPGLSTAEAEEITRLRRQNLAACARALRDELLIEELERIHAENDGVYGVWKMHHAMVRAGWEISRDQGPGRAAHARSWPSGGSAWPQADHDEAHW